MLPSLSDVTAIRPAGLYADSDHDITGFGGINPSSLPKKLADLVRVPINYVLEIHQAGQLVCAVSLPNHPSMIKVERPAPTVTTYTLGRHPVREHTEHRYLRISLQGRSGLRARPGYNRRGEVVNKPGPLLLQEFDAFLDYYQRLAKKSSYLSSPADFRTRQNQTYLVFRAFDEKIHLKTEVLDWSFNRDSSRSRFSFEWALNLQAYAPAVPDAPGNFLGPIADAATWIAEALSAVNGVLALADNLLANARSDLEVLRAPLRALRETGERLRSIGESAGSIANFPRQLVNDLAAVSAELRGTTEEFQRARQTWQDGPIARFFSDLQASEIAAMTAVGIMGGAPTPDAPMVVGQGLRVTDTLEPEGDRPQGDVIDVRWNAGTTLAQLALDYLGAEEAWRTLAEFNGLLDARHHGDGRPILPGDIIQIPGSGQGRREYELAGRDLQIDAATGDLLLDFGDTDFRSVSGGALIEQAIRHRLLTSQRDSRNFPQYGLPVAPGQVLSSDMSVYAATHIHDQLRRDARIVAVVNLAVLADGDTLGVTAQVKTAAGDTTTIIAPVQSGQV